MARAKRPRPKPDTSKPPKLAQSSWKDRRAPARGKRAGVPTKPRQSAPVATSQSGKPTQQGDLSAIPSSPAAPPKRGRKSKGKVEQPEQKFEKRTLSTKEQQAMALRAVRLSAEIRRKKRALQRSTKTERDAIKELEKQHEQLETQADQGYELVPEGDLFADRNTKRDGPAETIGGGPEALSPTAADEALRKIAGGGNGKHVEELPPGAPPLADDLDRAAQRDLAEHPAPPA